MASNKLILRSVNSGFPTPFNDTVLNKVLSHADLDNNQIYLKSEIIHTGTTSGTVVTFNKIGGKTIDIDLNSIISGTTGTNKFSITTGFTGSVLKTITHGLATTDIIVQVYDMNNNCQITPVICFNGSNDVDITISVTGTYKVVVIG